MKERGFDPRRALRLLVLLALAPLCVGSLHAQDVSTEPAAPPSDPSVADATQQAIQQADQDAAQAVDQDANQRAIRQINQQAAQQADPQAIPDASTDAVPQAAPASSPILSASTPVYYPETTAPSTYGSPSYGIVRPIPASELGTTQYGIPESALFPLTGADSSNLDPLAAHNLWLTYGQEAKYGNAQANISLGGAGIGLSRLPFIHRGPAPETADLKLGPLYLDFDSLYSSLIYSHYSSNSSLTNGQRHSELLAIMALNMTLTAQITDDLQIAVNGSLIYLPIQNVVGLTSSSLNTGLGFVVSAIPLLASQVTYDALIAGWDVRFADDFNITTGSYSDSTRQYYDVFDNSTLSTSENGAYVFHSGHTDLRDSSYNDNNNSQLGNFNVFANTLSAATAGYAADDLEVTARAVRTDLWYNQSNRGLPTSRDDFFIMAEYAKPTMRFTPFASYDISHSSDSPGVYQTVRAGFFGPITDQLFITADAGYYLSNSGHQGAVWLLQLHHAAGPYTTEDAGFSQGLNDFNDELVTTEYYHLNQVLGPTLVGYGVADHSRIQELSNQFLPGRTEDNLGVAIKWLVGPLTTLTAGGFYTHQHFGDSYTTNTWTGRLDLSRTITDTLYLRALYQYQSYATNVVDRGYSQNLLYVSLTKYFH